MNTQIQLSELTSRDKLSRLVSDFRNDVLEGNMNPLLAEGILKALEDFTKQLRGDVLVKDCVREELDRYPEKVVTFNGVTFTKKTVKTEYDYSKCNDPVLRDFEELIEGYKARLKDRQEWLKTMPEEGIDIAIPETGEVVHIVRPVKRTTDGFSVSLNDSKPAYKTMHEQQS